MNRVLFSGKVFNEEELKRVNAILQTQAALVWASVRTYSFEYQKGRKMYLEGYLSGSSATSDWSDTTKTVQATAQMLQGKVVEGFNEAQQAGQQAREEEASDQRNDNDATETVNNGSTVQEIEEGLPENDGFEDPGRESEIDDFLKQWDEATEQERADLEKAQEAANEAAQRESDIYSAGYLIDNESTGTQTYVNEDGETRTVDTYYDGDGNYVNELQGYTDQYGNQGTLTTITDPTTGETTTSFTYTDESGTHTVPGTDSVRDVLSAEKETAAKEANAAYEDAKSLQNEIDQRTKTYNEMAKQNAEDNKDPDSGNGGYSESDSSTWSDPSYDPGEWGGF